MPHPIDAMTGLLVVFAVFTALLLASYGVLRWLHERYEWWDE
jgi:hypothetical protein